MVILKPRTVTRSTRIAVAASLIPATIAAALRAAWPPAVVFGLCSAFAVDFAATWYRWRWQQLEGLYGLYEDTVTEPRKAVLARLGRGMQTRRSLYLTSVLAGLVIMVQFMSPPGNLLSDVLSLVSVAGLIFEAGAIRGLVLWDMFNLGRARLSESTSNDPAG